MEDQAPLYCLALLGIVLGGQAEELKQEIAIRLKGVGLELGKDVSLFEGDLVHFYPAIDRCSAPLCFSTKGGGAPHNDAAVGQLIKRRVPLIPVATCKDNFAAEFPRKLGGLNCLEMKGGLGRLAMALLEGASLLPKQRRVLLSYRRVESTNAALQLYSVLSARQYDVFLDTHDILPGEHFQEVLWHRLLHGCALRLLSGTARSRSTVTLKSRHYRIWASFAVHALAYLNLDVMHA